MTIFATSDLHGNLEQFKAAVRRERPQIVVVAGDLVDMSCVKMWSAGKVWKEFRAFCREMPGTKFVLVGGNHDTLLWGLAMFTSPLPNLTLLGDRTVARSAVVNGVRFAGCYEYNGYAPSADVLVYHRDPLNAGRNGGRPVLTATDAKYVLYGHEHSSPGLRHRLGTTQVVNVSNLAHEGYEYEYWMVDYPTDPTEVRKCD